MTPQRMLANGCMCFLASSIYKRKEKKLDLTEVLVVIEFVKVFPEELPSLPPAREISFEIELLPRTRPISKIPYNLAPSELKELQIQLQ